MSASALIIDDHPLYRDALSQLLGAMLGESHVRAVSSAEEGLRLAPQLQDLRLVLLDAAHAVAAAGYRPMRHAALRLLVTQVTSAREVLRITRG